MNSEDWKEKIRKDYHGIFSKEQIENTIGYWEEIIQAEREKAYETGMQYNYDLGRGKGHQEERERIIDVVENMVIETAGNSAKTVEQVLSIIKRKK